MRRLVSELFAAVEKSSNKKEELIAAIRENPAVFDVMKVCYDPKWEFAIPEGYPPSFKLDDSTPVGLSISEIVRERRKLDIFKKEGNYPNLSRARRELLFTQFLEVIHHTEAEALVFAKDHALTEIYPSITKELYEEVLPLVG